MSKQNNDAASWVYEWAEENKRGANRAKVLFESGFTIDIGK